MKLCWWTLSKIYEELKDIFDENKQGFDGKSRTLSHIFAFLEMFALLFPCFCTNLLKAPFLPANPIQYIFVLSISLYMSRAIMGQRGNLRALAEIMWISLKLFLAVVIKRKFNSWDVRSFNRLFETSSSSHVTAPKQTRQNVVMATVEYWK